MPSETTEGRFESLVTLNRALLTQHLLRGFAHDLRNQLQVLALGVTLENASSSPLLGERLEHAIHSMANSLDQLARLGRMEPDAQQHANLGEVISGVVRLAELQRNLPSRRIEVYVI